MRDRNLALRQGVGVGAGLQWPRRGLASRGCPVSRVSVSPVENRRLDAANGCMRPERYLASLRRGRPGAGAVAPPARARSAPLVGNRGGGRRLGVNLAYPLPTARLVPGVGGAVYPMPRSCAGAQPASL